MESIWSMDVVVPFSSILAAVLISTAGVIFGRLKLAMIVQFGFLVYWGRLWDITIFSDSASWLSGRTLLISGVCFILLVFVVLGLTVHRE